VGPTAGKLGAGPNFLTVKIPDFLQNVTQDLRL
jgi:hypothetical protein